MNASPGTEGFAGSLDDRHCRYQRVGLCGSDRLARNEHRVVRRRLRFGQHRLAAECGSCHIARRSVLRRRRFDLGPLGWLGHWTDWQQPDRRQRCGPPSMTITGRTRSSTRRRLSLASRSPAASPPNMAGTDSGASASGTLGGWGGDSTSVALTYGGDFGAAKVKAQGCLHQRKLQELHQRFDGYRPRCRLRRSLEWLSGRS